VFINKKGEDEDYRRYVLPTFYSYKYRSEEERSDGRELHRRLDAIKRGVPFHRNNTARLDHHITHLRRN
jgi:hypothetical protein